MMKILWFTNTPCSASEKLYSDYNRGGWLASLEKEITNNDEVELHISFFSNQKIEPFLYKRTYYHPIFRKNKRSKFFRYASRLFDRELNDKIEINNLLSIIDSVKPELIHIHGTEENFGLISKYINIPIIISIQGLLNSIVEKFYSGIPYSIANKYESLSKKILLTSSKYSIRQLKYKAKRECEILKNCSYIIGRTTYDYKITKILSPFNKYYIVNEILRPVFYINEWSKKINEKKRIVSILGDETYKGFETILKTAEILLTYPNMNFEWHIAGINKKSSIVTISEKWLKTNHLSLNIKLLGNLNDTALVDLLKFSDIYCQVSHIENSPNSLCEAMILGVPSIASFSGGTSSILENNVEGILVQDGDPFVLAGSIIELSEDFIKAKRFGEHARIKALKRHDKTFISNEIIKIYKSLVN